MRRHWEGATNRGGDAVLLFVLELTAPRRRARAAPRRCSNLRCSTDAQREKDLDLEKQTYILRKQRRIHVIFTMYFPEFLPDRLCGGLE